ncbi:MAG TPA: L-threonylcarbamoyladenylate synthase [Candidatus Baltobacteraceae bacterium]|nr:L-threonylcarbamoyladenylate synthase [Candidatus Baltobacteraceae bacterium]
MTDKTEIEQAARIVREGGLVVFPTETVYGLGANALDANAVRKIYALKGRPATSPLIVHVASIEEARELAAEWLPEAERLARQYWPGPLTLVVPKKNTIPDEVTAGLPTVGMRMPRHPVALELLRAAGVPIAAPSANRFTQLSPTTAEHVREAFGADMPFLLDGGPCEVGLESTVIAVTREGLEVLRPGMAYVNDASAAYSNEAGDAAQRSPGQHRKHYSPKTRVVLVSRGHLPKDGRGAYLWLDYNAVAAGRQRMPAKPEEYAAELYSTLHKLDGQGFDWIAVELPPDLPEWEAIRDRLVRAAY